MQPAAGARVLCRRHESFLLDHNQPRDRGSIGVKSYSWTENQITVGISRVILIVVSRPMSNMASISVLISFSFHKNDFTVHLSVSVFPLYLLKP